MDIAIVLYDRFTALDAIGPYEVLSRLPGATAFVARGAGTRATDNGMLAVIADASLAELAHPDVVLVPGGPGQVALTAGGRVHEWLRAAHETTPGRRRCAPAR